MEATLVTEATDYQWNYFISAYDEAKNELIFAKAGNEATANYLVELFQKDGLTRAQWRNLADA
jgi:predicted PolB exonuclease-like 3'-5' exonuclease